MHSSNVAAQNVAPAKPSSGDQAQEKKTHRPLRDVLVPIPLAFLGLGVYRAWIEITFVGSFVGFQAFPFPCATSSISPPSSKCWHVWRLRVESARCSTEPGIYPFRQFHATVNRAPVRVEFHAVDRAGALLCEFGPRRSWPGLSGPGPSGRSPPSLQQSPSDCPRSVQPGLSAAPERR